MDILFQHVSLDCMYVGLLPMPFFAGLGEKSGSLFQGRP